MESYFIFKRSVFLWLKMRAGLSGIVGALISAYPREIYYRYAASRQYGFIYLFWLIPGGLTEIINISQLYLFIEFFLILE